MSKYGVVDPDDVRKTAEGLKGRYAASDLYQRYSDVVRSDGRSPGHPVALGQALKTYGFRRCKITVGGGGRGYTGRGRQVAGWAI